MTRTVALTPGVVLGHELSDELRRTWLHGVHRTLRDRGGEVVDEVIDPGPGTNYYAVRVRLHRDVPALLLLNAPARIVAAAREDDETMDGNPLDFLPVPGPEVFLELGLAVAAVEDLTAVLREEHCASLTRFEQQAVAYHRPATVGEVLFNRFD